MKEPNCYYIVGEHSTSYLWKKMRYKNLEEAKKEAQVLTRRYMRRNNYTVTSYIYDSNKSGIIWAYQGTREGTGDPIYREVDISNGCISESKTMDEWVSKIPCETCREEIYELFPELIK